MRPSLAGPSPTTTCSDPAVHRVESGGSLFLATIDSWCQDPFGIVDFDWGNDICGPYPCPGERTSRMFRQAVGGEWVNLQQHPYGGCGEIGPSAPTSRWRCARTCRPSPGPAPTAVDRPAGAGTGRTARELVTRQRRTG